MTKQGKIRTGSNTFTHYFEDNGQVYPCRCGETHRDFYDWARHECSHDEVWLHDEIEGIGYCVECGKTIHLVSGS